MKIYQHQSFKQKKNQLSLNSFNDPSYSWLDISLRANKRICRRTSLTPSQLQGDGIRREPQTFQHWNIKWRNIIRKDIISSKRLKKIKNEKKKKKVRWKVVRSSRVFLACLQAEFKDVLRFVIFGKAGLLSCLD